MKNKPKFIFLQMGLEKEGSVEDFNSLARDFVTWEDEQIYSDDLKFLSIDFVFARIKELEIELNKSIEFSDILNYRFRIDELKNLLR